MDGAETMATLSGKANVKNCGFFSSSFEKFLLVRLTVIKQAQFTRSMNYLGKMGL